jgi:glycerol uptake facilitator-like aquaporin
MWPEAGDTGTVYFLVYSGAPVLGAFIAAVWHKWIQEESF